MARLVEPVPSAAAAIASNSTYEPHKEEVRRVTSTTFNSAMPRRMTICGTNEYMAPELHFDEEYSFSVDIFCFGMVIFEILKRQQVGKNGFLVRKPKEK